MVCSYVPISSRSPALDELCRGKKKIVVFNKTDMSDPEANKVSKLTAWLLLLILR